MKYLSLEYVSFKGFIPGYPLSPFEVLNEFSHTFEFGKSYFINGYIGQGAWALCWLIAGALKPDHGIFRKDGELFAIHARKKESWLVRQSEIKRWGIFHQSVKAQIHHGLRTQKSRFSEMENEIIWEFHLTPQRYTRPLRQLSHEAWRASCSIGLVHGKRIFCFPHLGYLHPGFLKENHNLWLKEQIDLLKSHGALVFVPANLDEYIEGLFDEIVDVPF